MRLLNLFAGFIMIIAGVLALDMISEIRNYLGREMIGYFLFYIFLFCITFCFWFSTYSFTRDTARNRRRRRREKQLELNI
jgi:hypothetical protein